MRSRYRARPGMVAVSLLTFLLAVNAGFGQQADQKPSAKDAGPALAAGDGGKKNEKADDPGRHTASLTHPEAEKGPLPSLDIPSFADMTAKWLHAQEAGEPWRSATSGPFVTFTAPIIAQGHLVAQPLFFYNFVRGTFDEDSHYHSLPKGEMRQQGVWSLFTQYGFMKDTEFDAQLNLIYNKAKEAGERASSTGLGDTQLALRHLLMHETASWHPEIAAIGQIKLPTGKFEHAAPRELGTDIMGTGSTDLTLGLDFTKSIKPFVLHADIWHSWPIATRVDDVHTRYGDYICWNVAAEIPFWKDRLAYMVEFNGMHQARTNESGYAVPESRVDNIIFGTGLEFIFSGNAQLLVGYQRTLWGTNVDAVDAVAATLVLNF